MGMFEKIAEGAIQLDRVRRRAGESESESRRTVLVVGGNRSAADAEQAVVPESCHRRICRIKMMQIYRKYLRAKNASANHAS
jgi:lysine/ornithine N-monooxygenase